MFQEPATLGTHDPISGESRSWFVYLFALADCSGFKVGFSCNPLHRIYTFSRRYYERFDVHQSWLLELEAEDQARAVEAALKADLAEFRAEAPGWIPEEAGGHTEWFTSIHFTRAEVRLRSFLQSYEAARMGSASDFIRSELARLSSNFESWAWGQAQHVGSREGRALRDWLDAYHFFDVPLFVDDPSVLRYVRDMLRDGLGRSS